VADTITVGITSYNLLRYLPGAVGSALGHKVIVVDDASTDGSGDWLRENGVECIQHAENSGSAVKAWNELIDAADTEWLVLLSADDELSPDFAEQVTCFGERADWVWGNLAIIDRYGAQIDRWDYRDFPKTVAECFERMRETGTVYPTFLAAFRVSWLRENNLRAESFTTTTGFADTITGWRWLHANPRLGYTGMTFAKYRRWGGSESFTADRKAMQQELAAILGGSE
jgi:glycosyltransferase involved in cell wall biosynthesis